MKNGIHIIDAIPFEEAPDLRMFTNSQETRIFSAVGKLAASLKRVRDTATVFQADMTMRVSAYAMKDIASEVDGLVMLVMEALQREEPISDDGE